MSRETAITTPPSILVVEDSAAQGELLSEALRHHGWEGAIRMEHGLESALTYLREQLKDHGPLPRLVLVDLKLRNESGLDVVRYIRRDTPLRHVPVVILTTSDDWHDIEASYGCGANAYVVKPSTYADLVKLMGDLCHFWLSWNRTA